jgi:hypothetical protein
MELVCCLEQPASQRQLPGWLADRFSFAGRELCYTARAWRAGLNRAGQHARAGPDHLI